MAAKRNSPTDNRDGEEPAEDRRVEPEVEEQTEAEEEEDEDEDDEGDDYGRQGERRDEEGVKQEEVGGGDEKEDSKESPSSTSEEKPEFVLVDLHEIRRDVQCPICLGIIKKTRTVMDCLHRFCRECIDKSMRLGNNECPACRKHCASRRSLRDDPNFDALIAALYPDIDKYEEEELAFHEEEKIRNKQIQASIAQVSRRQSEALVKRRSLGKESAVLARSQRSHGSGSRRRRNCRTTEHQTPDDHEDDNDETGGKDSSSADERCPEGRQRKRRRRAGWRSGQPSSSGAHNNGNCIENDSEAYRETRGISPGLVWNPENLAWGRGGARSHTRHGTVPGGNNKNVRNARLNKLVDYLRGLEESNAEMDVHLKLVSSDTKSSPNLKQPYLCCRRSLSVKQLREYVALQMQSKAEDIELLALRGRCEATAEQPVVNHLASASNLQSLDDQEILAGLRTACKSNLDHLIIAYRQKQTE